MITKLINDSKGCREISLEALELKDRTLTVFGQITNEMANDFIRKMRCLVKESDEPITVLINSQGGEVQAGLSMYDAIVGAGVTVNTVCTGMAFSMGAVLMVVGNKRLMLPHSKYMLHEPLAMGEQVASASTISERAKSILEVKELLNQIIAKYAKKTLKEINKVTSKDTYFTAEEAVEFGLADNVVTFKEVFS